MSRFAIILLTLASSLSFANVPQKLQCDEVWNIDAGDKLDRAITINLNKKIKDPPYAVIVKNLPDGSPLSMNFQDIFQLGKQPHGVVFYATGEESDGMIQEMCGSESFNTLIEVEKTKNIYCAKCF